MTNMGLIDHPLTPLIVAWMEAEVLYASYSTAEHRKIKEVARDLLNAALEELK